MDAISDAAVAEMCEQLSEGEECVVHELMSRLADKWSLWTLSVLAEAGGPLRFSRVRDGVEGISQKSLTKTLKQLERDGLVTRRLYPEVPPRVEYAPTPLGLELLEHVKPLWVWVAEHARVFSAARQQYDGGRAHSATTQEVGDYSGRG